MYKVNIIFVDIGLSGCVGHVGLDVLLHFHFKSGVADAFDHQPLIRMLHDYADFDVYFSSRMIKYGYLFICSSFLCSFIFFCYILMLYPPLVFKQSI